MVERLPSDVWQEIFLLLPISSISILSRVCKRWQKICTSNIFKVIVLRHSLRGMVNQASASKLDLHRDHEKHWTPSEPGSVNQFFRSCIYEPEHGAAQVLARSWNLLLPISMPVFLLSEYASAASPEDEKLIMQLICRLGLACPLDIYRNHCSLMALVVSLGARYLTEASELLATLPKVKQAYRSENNFPSRELPPPSDTAFITLLLGKTSPKSIAEQMTLRSWEAYTNLAPSHFSVPRQRRTGLLAFLSQETNGLNLICSHALLTQKDKKQRRTIMDRLAQILAELIELRNYHMAMGLFQTLNNRWFGGVRVANAASRSYTKQLEKANAMFTATYNYRAYRALLVDRSTPFIPSLTLPLVDVRFVLDTHPIMVTNAPPETGCNWRRLEAISNIIRDALAGQSRPYSIPLDATILRILDSSFGATITHAALDALYDALA